MGTKERRERQREELKEKILEAARALFLEHGYEAVTMRQIATAIEYSPTAIYHHFKDKRAVFLALCTTDFSSLADKFRKIARLADPIERLQATGRAYAAFALEHPNHYRLMFMTPHPPHLPEDTGIDHGNPEEDAYAFLKWTVQQAIDAGRIRAELADPELLSQIVWAGVHGIVSLRITKSTDPWVAWRSEKRSVEAMLDLQLHGMLAGGKG